jgi:hypothetical protein
VHPVCFKSVFLINFRVYFLEFVSLSPLRVSPSVVLRLPTGAQDRGVLTHWHTQPAVRWAEPSMPLQLILALCQ